MSEILDGKDDFTIYTPGVVDIIEKGGQEDIESLRPIGGWCSTERLDRQEEVVLAKGLDFAEFVQHGYYNDNHKQDTAAVLGAPKLAELRDNRWWTEGNLISGYEPADKIWALAKALKKSGLNRRLGFSIEGKVTERGFDNRIVRAIIRHVAITNSPVNVDCTWDVLAKSFGTADEVEASSLRQTFGSTVVRDNSFTSMPLIEAAFLIKKARPNYSWVTCERLAKMLYKMEERRN